MKMVFLSFLLLTTLCLTFIAPADATAPAGSFVSAVTTGTAPLTVQFIDSSTNTPTSWTWSFGDSGTSTEQNPTHTYTSAGTYTVTLTVTNADGSDTISKTDYITSSETLAAPVASYISAVTSGTAPLTVQFADSSTNTPTSWAWSFGDGSTSTSQNPSHTYSSAGSYTVTLTAINAGGSNTISQSSYITVTEEASVPVASFVSAVTTGTAPLTVQFADSSTNTPTSWAWSFGDGSTSTEQNPSHTYSSEGSYTVTLTATNTAGSDTSSQEAYITVTDAEPVASFTSNMTYGTAPFAIQFNDTSANSPTSWSWAFGDGGTSTEQNPVYEYTDAGNYTVSLTATNSAGSNSTYTSSYITVDAVSTPAPSFTADVRKGLAALTVTFTDTSANSPT
ncbi:MAG: PKD domain-containing protein [Methanomicrobiales archaeon]|nr:PKD domain-containing protein [Methanomicrobiales archaeon]